MRIHAFSTLVARLYMKTRCLGCPMQVPSLANSPHRQLLPNIHLPLRRPLLVKEGILAPVPDKKRHYQLGDAKPFLAAVDVLKATHSQSGKAKPKVKAKAATRMSKNKAKPATGK